MQQFLTLLKLEFLVKNPRRTIGGKLFPKIVRWVILALGITVILGILLFAFNGVISICVRSNIEQEFIVFYTFIIQTIQLLFGLSLTTKTLYFSADSDVLKLPLDGKIIFLAKITYLFIYELAFTAILNIPMFIMYGVLTSQGVAYFLMLLPNIIFFPIIPFLLGLILSVPTMYIVAYLKTKFVAMLLIYVFFVVVGFTLYIYALKFILGILQSGEIVDVFSSQIILGIKSIANFLYLPVLFKNSLLIYRFLPSILINFTLVITLGFLIIYFANKIYLKIILDNSESGGSAYSRKIKIKDRSVTGALFFREFLTIFRSVNYSFQYLTIVITTPLMVYFSNKIASSIGVDQLGEGILPGVSVLVLIMFLTMGSSFAATSFTREGGNFFHTKIIPVSYTKQVTVKFLLYVIVAIPSIMISCIVLAFVGFLSYFDAALIGLAVCLIIVGNIAGSMLLDIKRPQFMYLDGKEITGTTKNVNTSLSIGFIIAALMGVGSIIVAYLVSMPAIYLVLYGFAVPYIIIEVFGLFYKLEKRYTNIEA